MRVPMENVAEDNNKILAGSMSGRMACSKLLELTKEEPLEPELFFLDFGNIDVATASYLRESILAFRETVRKKGSNWYPIVANCRDLVEDEFRVLVAANNDALMLCSLDKDDKPTQPRLVGKLDPKQRMTFDLVQAHRETNAAELMREHGKSENTNVQTAWNNRLAALVNLGLVVEINEGRTKRYRSLFAEV